MLVIMIIHVGVTITSYAGTTKFMVVTDAEGILGIGDQGFGGIGDLYGQINSVFFGGGHTPN